MSYFFLKSFKRMKKKSADLQQKKLVYFFRQKICRVPQIMKTLLNEKSEYYFCICFGTLRIFRDNEHNLATAIQIAPNKHNLVCNLHVVKQENPYIYPLNYFQVLRMFCNVRNNLGSVPLMEELPWSHLTICSPLTRK